MISNVLVLSTEVTKEQILERYERMSVNIYVAQDEFQALAYLSRNACQAAVIHMGEDAQENTKLLVLMRCILNVNVLAAVNEGYRHEAYLDYATEVYQYPCEYTRLETDLKEMVAETVLRGKERIDFYHCRGLVHIPCYHKVFYGREEIRLARREYGLLELLIENRHKILHKEQILGMLWEDDIQLASESTLKSHINRLRNKLAVAQGKEFIETVYRFGYRFMEYPGPEQLKFVT